MTELKTLKMKEEHEYPSEVFIQHISRPKEEFCKCGHYVEMLASKGFVCLHCGKKKFKPNHTPKGINSQQTKPDRVKSDNSRNDGFAGEKSTAKEDTIRRDKTAGTQTHEKGCGKYIEERDNYCGLEKKDDFCFYSGSYDTLCPKCKKKLGGGE